MPYRLLLLCLVLALTAPRVCIGFCPTGMTRPRRSFREALVDPEDLDYLTPQQVKALRKEVSKRSKQRKLQSVPFDDNDNCLDEAASILQTDELVQIRSISIEDKRKVFDTVESLAEELSLHMQFPVFLVDTQGHKAVYYSPTTNKIQLRTTGKLNQWEKRPRKPRDNAGQIIREE